MSERRFNILFSGQILEGHTPNQVRENLQALFKLDDSALDKLFTGEPIAIKKNLDRKTAIQYQTALGKAGANIQVVMVREETVAKAPQSTQQNTQTHSDTQSPSNTASHSTNDSTTHNNELSLKPVGSDLLDSNERKTVVEASIKTEHIQLEKVNPFLDADLSGAPSSSTPSNIQEPDWSVAEVGSLLVEPQSHTENSVDVDISYLDIDPLGVNLIEAIKDIPSQAFTQLESLSLAEAGDDLLKDCEKKTTPSVTINTEHLSTE